MLDRPYVFRKNIVRTAVVLTYENLRQRSAWAGLKPAPTSEGGQCPACIADGVRCPGHSAYVAFRGPSARPWMNWWMTGSSECSISSGVPLLMILPSCSMTMRSAIL